MLMSMLITIWEAAMDDADVWEAAMDDADGADDDEDDADEARWGGLWFGVWNPDK